MRDEVLDHGEDLRLDRHYVATHADLDAVQVDLTRIERDDHGSSLTVMRQRTGRWHAEDCRRSTKNSCDVQAETTPNWQRQDMDDRAMTIQCEPDTARGAAHVRFEP